MISSSKRGFTLLELLVVVAIVGLLAGLTIYGLRESRLRADDANVEYHVVQIPSILENRLAQTDYMYADELVDDCGELPFSDEDVTALLVKAERTAAAPAECVADPEGFAISLDLRGQEDMEYCLDAEGFKGLQPVGTHTGDDPTCQ